MKYFEKSRKIYGENDVRCKVDGQEEYREVDGHVEMEEAADKPERLNDVRWYGHVLRQPEENV